MNYFYSPLFRWFVGVQLVLIIFIINRYGTAQSSIDSLAQVIRTTSSDSSRAYHYLLLSNAYLDEGQLDSSLWAAQESYQLGNQFQWLPIKIWSQHLEGNYFYYAGAYDKAIAIQSLVRDQAEEASLIVLRACAQKMIGWIYLEMGKEQEALALFQESLAIFKKHGHEDFQRDLGISYYGVGTALFILGEYKNAKLYYDSAITAKPSLKPREVALVLADRAALLRDAFNQPREALSDAILAWKIIEKKRGQDDAKAYVLSEVALTKAVLGYTTESTKDATKAFELYELQPLTKRYRSVYESLARAFVLSGDFAMAFRTEQKKTTLMDSIYQWRRVLTIEELQTQYETEKSMHQIDLLSREKLQNQLENTQFKTALWVISSVLVTLIIGTLIYQVKREKYLRKIRHLEAEQKIQEEKERIKRDLHDSLGSQLSSIAMGLNREVTRSNNQNLAGLQELADKAISELRDSLWVIDKDKISAEELGQRVATLFWQYQKLEIPVQMEFKRTGGEHYFFSSKTASHVFRIIQEALHNAIKHSECSRISIEMNFDAGQIKLSIRDNGKGMQTTIPVSEDHFGLHNIQRRATQLNAQLTISSKTNEGTEIVLVLPLYSIKSSL